MFPDPTQMDIDTLTGSGSDFNLDGHRQDAGQRTLARLSGGDGDGARRENANMYVDVEGSNTPPDSDPVCGDLTRYQAALLSGSNKYTFRHCEAYAFSFKIEQGQKGLIAFGSSTDQGNGYHEKRVTISSYPGDFSSTAVRSRGGPEGGVYVDVLGEYDDDNPYQPLYCHLAPNQTYYFNIRNYSSITGEDPCGTNELCGFVLSSNWSG